MKNEKQAAKAEYMTKDGKHFLKIDGEYKEVEIQKVKGGLRVMPVNSLKSSKLF